MSTVTDNSKVFWTHIDSGARLKMVMNHQDGSYTFENEEGMRLRYYNDEVKKDLEYW